MTYFDFCFIGLFIVIPAVILFWFVYSLIRFIKRDETDEESCGKRRNSLIVSGAFTAVLVVCIAFMAVKLLPEISKDISFLSGI